MKRFFSILLFTVLILSLVLTACSDGGETESVPKDPSDGSGEPSVPSSEAPESAGESEPASESEESASESEPEESSEPSETSEPSGEPKTYPVVSGTFMQPGTFAGYSVSRMKQHLSYMKEVGIDTLVLQWSFNTNGGKINTPFFESSFPSELKATGFNAANAKFMDVLLTAAEETGVKVWIGLNDSDEWWIVGVSDRSWIEKQAKLGLAGAEQIYATYKEKYPNAFAGWYFVFEFYNMQANAAMLDNAADLLNRYRNGLYKLSPELPMMLSPFISEYGVSPAETQNLWSQVFAKTDFRKGDIFCCQDSVGAGHITMDKLEPYFKAIKNAADTKPELSFWANNEDFTQSDWSTADLKRFVKQLEISDPYVEGHLTFAYSHYQNPDVGKTGYHEAYKAYYQTGKIPGSALSEPKVEYEASGDGSSVKFTISIDNASKTLMGVKVLKNGSLIKFIDFSQNYGKEAFSVSCTDNNLQGSGSAEYKVFGVDYCGNEGKAFTFTVHFESRSGQNIAAGKTYSLPNPPQASYPDEDGKALTDGKNGQPTYGDPAWLGFLGKTEIIIDLGKTVSTIYGFEVDTMGGGEAAIFAPNEVTFSVSDDGKTFKDVQTFRYPADPDAGALFSVALKEMLSADASGRYAKITVSTNQSWIFIDEVKIIAD